MQNKRKPLHLLALSVGLVFTDSALCATATSILPVTQSASAPNASVLQPVQESTQEVATSEFNASETPIEKSPSTDDSAASDIQPVVVPPSQSLPPQKDTVVNQANSSSASSNVAAETSSMIVADESKAASALGQQETDASASKNLSEVFTAAERVYSLSKRGSYSLVYDLNYSYYRDSRLDLALDDGSSTLTRLRIEEDAQHTLSNTFSLQYGLFDNLTLTASLPIIAKSDLLKDTTTAGLGDLSLGARWEPFPLESNKLPLVLNGSLSTKTGDSPYEINPNRDLSTGKGYYSIGGGASTRKFIDPIVLFGSGSLSYGIPESDLNQRRGSRILDEYSPGLSGGIALGFAYSLNYDVSLTMSYQQSFATGSEFVFTSGESSAPADQTSASLGISLGVRASPKTIVNTSIGFGLTEDAPDVSLGVSFPLDFLGIGRELN